MEPLALAREEPSDTGRVVRRLDELDLGLADGEERDPHPVLPDLLDRLERQPEHVPPEAGGILDLRDDQRDMVDLAEATDAVGDGRDGRRHVGLLRP